MCDMRRMGVDDSVVTWERNRETETGKEREVEGEGEEENWRSLGGRPHPPALTPFTQAPCFDCWRQSTFEFWQRESVIQINRICVVILNYNSAYSKSTFPQKNTWQHLSRAFTRPYRSQRFILVIFSSHYIQWGLEITTSRHIGLWVSGISPGISYEIPPECPPRGTAVLPRNCTTVYTYIHTYNVILRILVSKVFQERISVIKVCMLNNNNKIIIFAVVWPQIWILFYKNRPSVTKGCKIKQAEY